jgi:hypothetical protein
LLVVFAFCWLFLLFVDVTVFVVIEVFLTSVVVAGVVVGKLRFKRHTLF